MRLAHVLTPNGPRPAMADADEWVVVDDLFAAEPTPTGERLPQRGTRLLAPVQPRVVLGMAHNGEPGDRELPPQAFMKSARTVVGPDAPIVLDHTVGAVKGEAELVLVVGRECRHLDAESAKDAVLGWTVGNDVTNVEQADGFATQVKNGDGYTPIGPWIETDLVDVLDCGLVARLNGEQVASSRTGRLAWNPYEALAYLSRYMTLGPGDIVLTGSPATGFPISPGDTCACSVDGIGVLENPVIPLARNRIPDRPR